MNSLKKWKILEKSAFDVTSSSIKKLYKKDGLLAIAKPYGLPVHGGPRVKRSLMDLMPDLEKRYELPVGSLELANRLDKNVSGVLLLTYDRSMASYIASLQQERKILKTYLAVLVGSCSRRSGILSSDLVKAEGSNNRYMQTSISKKPTKAQATTDFEILDNNSNSCMLCEFSSRTGYKHQIRVHATQLLNCPILGDHKHHSGPNGPQPLPLRLMQLLQMSGVKSETGKGKIRPWQRALVPLHLVARKVIIPGLDGGDDVSIVAPIPPYFRDTMTNCDLLLNRAKVEEHKILNYKPRYELKNSYFDPKGVLPSHVTQETSL